MRRIPATLLALSLFAPTVALADDGDEVHDVGLRLGGHFVIAPDRPATMAGARDDAPFGGAGIVDAFGTLGPLELGGFFGVSATPSVNDVYNRVNMLLGAAATLALELDPVVVYVGARGGLWGGATQDMKLGAGGMVGGSLYLGIDLGADVTLDMGLDVWGLLGEGSELQIAPGLRLTFGGLAGA